VAGLLKVKDKIPTGATVVCVLTGNGLKDEYSNTIKVSLSRVEPAIAAVAEAMGL